MFRLMLAVPLLLAAAAVSPAAAAPPTPMPVIDPQTFADKAATGNLFEIQSSQLALKQTKTPTLVFFAKKMIGDHGAAGKDLAAAAKAEHVTVPTALDPLQADEIAELQRLEGRAFDTAYVQMQVMSHDQAVKLFDGYALFGKPGPLEDVAGKTLPTLKMHQQMIHSIAGF